MRYLHSLDARQVLEIVNDAQLAYFNREKPYGEKSTEKGKYIPPPTSKTLD